MPVQQATYDQILSEIEKFSTSAPGTEDLMSFVVQRLQQYLPHYNWVGFYLIEDLKATEPMLVLGPYIGAPTPHTRIPLNQGICGAAASSGETIIVDDVHSDPRYLSCSIETKSEIVVPVRVNGTVVGELDIDSHEPAAFTPADRSICERVAGIVGQFIERNS